MYITNNPDVAVIAQKYGVDRIWVDLEYKGKEERQRGMDTVKNHHTIKDVQKMRPFINKSELLVRVNPWNDESINEINAVIESGADIVMLPMWKSVSEVKEFIHIINGRVKNILLLETKEAETCLEDVLKLPGIDEIYIGLNDLSLSYHLSFMFELLSNGTVERLMRKIKEAGIPCGFGGIAKIGYGDVPAEMIILEHYRLGSTRAILSRTFCNSTSVCDIDKIDQIFKENIKKFYDFEHYAEHVSSDIFKENQEKLKSIISTVATKIKSHSENKIIN